MLKALDFTPASARAFLPCWEAAAVYMFITTLLLCESCCGTTPVLLKEFRANQPNSSACSCRIMSPVDGACFQGIHPIAERHIRFSGLTFATAACQQLLFAFLNPAAVVFPSGCRQVRFTKNNHRPATETRSACCSRPGFGVLRTTGCNSLCCF